MVMFSNALKFLCHCTDSWVASRARAPWWLSRMRALSVRLVSARGKGSLQRKCYKEKWRPESGMSGHQGSTKLEVHDMYETRHVL